MDYRNQLVIRDAVNKRNKRFKVYWSKNPKGSMMSGKKAVEDIVNLLDSYIDIEDISITVFDEITSVLADEALMMTFHQFRNHIWSIAEMCNLGIYNSRVSTKELFNRINWDGVYNAFEKEVAYGV